MREKMRGASKYVGEILCQENKEGMMILRGETRACKGVAIG
jgi:hypothetical protein